jgi:hypothetical protein
MTDSSGNVNSIYHSGSIEMQNRLDTRKVADHIAAKYVTDQLSDNDIDTIRRADCFYLATADHEGRPDCSYKGGLPGFVHIVDNSTIAFPSYDGAGMFRSLGNILVNPHVGLLFLDYERRIKLRLNGAATVSTDPADTARFESADAVVSVRMREVFENCPRYLHDRTTGEHSTYCPRPDYLPPDPEWKLKPEYDGIVRRNGDRAAGDP